jgi:hypothetical protein
LVITDEEGRERMQFGTSNGAICMWMLDANGMPKITLTVDRAGDPYICMVNPGKAGLLLGIKDGGNPGLALFDSCGDTRALLALDSGGNPSLSLSPGLRSQAPVEVFRQGSIPVAGSANGMPGTGEDR